MTLKDYSVPLSTEPGKSPTAKNKAAHQSSDDSFNSGRINANSLYYSPKIHVYGVERDDQVLGLDAYLDTIKEFRCSFSNLKIQNSPYIELIGSGDWTATVSRLSGKHTGTLKVPGYVLTAPIPASGKALMSCTTPLLDGKKG
ncbi:hypothetical protein AK830_g1605 [Neonectria ditissima]|uniref:Uncharacterized protein n=1 Tax=Neonectria ditissima TaxID=78410 RepID=A0A0P7BWQ3_9HYPO|nr:hypothetical protein AK830_g1605 [Neonectria ditissima]